MESIICILGVVKKAAHTVRRQLYDLGSKINVSFQPVFLSKKLEDELKITEKKPSIVNQQFISLNVVFVMKTLSVLR